MSRLTIRLSTLIWRAALHQPGTGSVQDWGKAPPRPISLRLGRIYLPGAVGRGAKHGQQAALVGRREQDVRGLTGPVTGHQHWDLFAG